MGMSIKSILTLFLVSLGALMFFTVSAQAAGLFTVEKITVDATADNAIAAREQAFNEAQVKAFTKLTKRLVEEGETEKLDTPSADTISTMIEDYEVTNERLSTTRYIGTYTFSFNERSVRRLFTSSGQSYTTTQSKPLLVLPFYQKGKSTTLWSPANVWMQAWGVAKKRNPLVPLIVPLGDLNDVRDLGDHQYMNFDTLKLSRLVDRYGAGEAVILVATADEKLSLVDQPNQPANGVVNVTIYRTDQGYSEAVDRFSLSAKPDQTLASLMGQTVAATQKRLTTSWKSRTVTHSSEVSNLNVIVPIQSLADWTDIRRSLDRTHLITKTTLKSLTPRAARITLDFQGTPQRLSLALDQVNLILGREDIDLIDGGSEPSYTLTRRTSRRSRLDASYGSQPTYAPPPRNYAQTF